VAKSDYHDMGRIALRYKMQAPVIALYPPRCR
jgi:hypothetical protein